MLQSDGRLAVSDSDDDMPPEMAPVVPLSTPQAVVHVPEECGGWCAKETLELRVECDAEGTPRKINEYTIEKELGAGSFGRVFRARREGDSQPGRRFAVKLTNRRRGGAAADAETAATRRLYHTNVCLLFEVIRPVLEDQIVLIQEFMAGGPVMEWYADEASYLQPATMATLDSDEAAAFLKDLVSGLGYLRQHRIVHRDIKPDNLLVYLYEDDRPRKRKLRICDFGCAVVDPDLLTEEPFLLHSTEGTMAFWSPEMCSSGDDAFDGYASDLWAAGVCLYCFTYGCLPTDMMGAHEEILSRLREFELPEVGDEIETDLRVVLEQMLTREAATRLTIPQILQSRFIEDRVPPDPQAPAGP